MIREEMIALTKKMVEIPSINTTEGEKEIGIFLENYLREIPYFKEHPEYVIVQELEDDKLHRRNVFAVLRGEKDGAKADTLVFNGHTDTVGLEGFGKLEPYACSPDLLAEKMKTVEITQEVSDDLESGDYIFGRGACDMKSGDAVFIEIVKSLSEHPENLTGNIVLSLNPVEENLHTGMIEGLEVLSDLKEKYGFHYIMAINNDFTCPLFPGDMTNTIYTGMVGKLLPCFYIQGKETHVGQCYEGFDASMAAANLVQKINLSQEFTDEYAGEVTYPPSVLKMKDLKPWYNVQTSAEALVYFNYFVHGASMEDITDKLLQAADESFAEVAEKIEKESQWFSEKTGQKLQLSDLKYSVFDFAKLEKQAKNCSEYDAMYADNLIENEIKKGTDKREVPICLIKYLLQVCNITHPCIVLYYAAPYCPHNTLRGKRDDLITVIEKIAAEVEQEKGVTYRFKNFYPSLSDSSFLKIDDSKESVETLLHTFPGFEKLYPVPISLIQKVDIPAVNYGVFGKDAHKWTERVYIPYTFDVLPDLIEKTVAYYL